MTTVSDSNSSQLRLSSWPREKLTNATPPPEMFRIPTPSSALAMTSALM